MVKGGHFFERCRQHFYTSTDRKRESEEMIIAVRTMLFKHGIEVPIAVALVFGSGQAKLVASFSSDTVDSGRGRQPEMRCFPPY